MKTTQNKLVNGFIITTFIALYLLVSVISTIHVIDFFKLSNPNWLAISLAIGFELGAAASLASLIILDKMNKTLVWSLFIVITAMQMQGNMYYAFVNLQDYQGWVELFNLVEWEPLAQKRLLAAVSGAILPLVALGFIKSLVDYIKPVKESDELTALDLEEAADAINHDSQKKTEVESEIELESNPVASIDKVEDFLSIDELLENTNIANETEDSTEDGNYVEEGWFDEFISETEDKKSVKVGSGSKAKKGAVEDQFEERVVKISKKNERIGPELKKWKT